MNECLVMLCKNDFYSSEDATANEAMMKHSGFPKTKQTSKSKVIFIWKSLQTDKSWPNFP